MSLSLNNVTKQFDKKLLFENLSFEFPEHGVFAVVGDSGVGKTTLLRMIAGLDKKFKGKITGGGFDNVSFVFQEYRLFDNLNALENITEAVFEKATKQNLEDALLILKQLGFSENDALLFPNELSGGMRQRVSIARALLKNSKVLLLDEPTKELDYELKMKLLHLIKNEGKRRLVIIVTHNADDILYLDAVKISI